MNRTRQWKQLKYVRNEIIGTYKHRTRGETHITNEYAYRCSLCERVKRLRWHEDCGCICLACYLSHKKCKCGKIASVELLCRDCYIKDEKPTLYDVVWKKTERTQPMPPGNLSNEFRAKLRKKMDELGYSIVEKQLNRNMAVK